MEVSKCSWKTFILTVGISFLLVMTFFLVKSNTTNGSSITFHTNETHLRENVSTLQKPTCSGYLESFTNCPLIQFLPPSEWKQCNQTQKKHKAIHLPKVPLSDLLLTGVKQISNEFLHHSKGSKNSDFAIFIFGNSGTTENTSTPILLENTHRQHSTENLSQIFGNADEEMMSRETISSNAIIPEYVVHNESGMAFWNCPRFDNPKGPETDIAALYFLKYAMNLSKSAKFLFAVSYSSVSSTDNQQDFDKLVTFATSLLKNINELTSSFGLVVTDVSDLEEKNGEVIFSEIIEFLREYLATKSMEKTAMLGFAKRDELQRKVDFLKGLLGENGLDTGHPRVYFSVCENMGFLEKAGSYTTDLEYSPIFITDIQFSLKEETLVQVKTKFIPQVVDQIANLITLTIKNFQQKIRNAFHAKVEINPELGMILITDTIDILSKTRFHQLGSAKVSLEMNTLIDMLPLKISYTNRLQMEILENQLEFLNMTVNYSFQTPKLLDTWLNSIKSMNTSLQELKDFFEFAKLTKHQLSAYTNQKKFMSLFKTSDDHFNPESVLQFLHINEMMKIPEQMKTFWLSARLEDKKYFANVVRKCFPRAEFSCQKSSTNSKMKTLVVHGRILKLSYVTDPTNWPTECTMDNVNEFYIVAMETVYFDEDFHAVGKSLYMAVIAPEWQIVNLEYSRSIKRQINLSGGDPIVFEKARNGTLLGESGEIGENGMPGENSGSFYGIYDTLEKEDLLEIYANGGRGGDGQDGGDGNIGHKGKDAVFEDFPAAYVFLHPTNIYELPWQDNIHKGSRFYMVGTEGNKGGSGGNGGNGGAPGKAGYVKIIRLQSREEKQITPKISIWNASGESGKPGQGGIGGKGGHQGDSLLCRRKTLFFWKFWKVCEKVNNETYAESGRNGTGGAIPDVLFHDMQIVFDESHIWRIINEYRKCFFWNDTEEMDSFLVKLDSDPQVNSILKPLAFGKELEALEEMFYMSQSLNLQNSLQAQYQYFLKRLEAFNEIVNVKKFSNQESVFLNMIYSTVLGKLAGFRRTNNKLKVIKTIDYFAASRGQLYNLRESGKEKAILKESERFKNKLNEKVEEANYFIEHNVNPAIKNAIKALGKLDSKLDQELHKLLRTAKIEVFNAESVQKLYKALRPLRIGLDVLNLVGTVTSFLGVQGYTVGTAISTSTSMIKGFIPGTKLSETPRLVLPDSFRKFTQDESNFYYETKVRALDKETAVWEKAAAKIDDDTLQGLKEKAEKRKQSIEELKKAVKNGSKSQNLVRLAKLQREMEIANDDFKTALAKKADVMKNKELALENVEKEKTQAKDAKYKNEAIFRNVARTMAAVDSVKGLSVNLMEDINGLDRLDAVLIQSEKNVEILEMKKARMYDEFLPQLSSIENDIERATDTLPGKSQVALSVKQWNVKGMIKLLRARIREFISGLSITEEFQHAIDTLDENLTILIDLYELIEQYEEKKQLADFIAKATIGNSALSDITDDELRGTVSNLEFYIQSNLFLEEHKYTLHAFKQWVFPFASHYLNDRNIHNRTGIPINADEVLHFYIKEQEFLQRELEKYKATTVSGDKYLIRFIFTSDAVSSEPFFVWENGKWQESIKSLLSGNPVRLLADVDKRGQPAAEFFRKKSAIKYKTIELTLKVKNEERQRELDEKLNHFYMNMTHSGISVYKVMGRHFVMFDSSQSYHYSFEKIGNDKHVSIGVVKYKIDGPDVDFLMSPYTWWTFQLFDAKSGGVGFSDLKEFCDEVELHLEGEAIYLDENHTPESVLNSLNLDKHYELYDPEGYVFDNNNN